MDFATERFLHLLKIKRRNEKKSGLATLPANDLIR